MRSAKLDDASRAVHRRRTKASPCGWSERSGPARPSADNSGDGVKRTSDHAGLVRRRRQHYAGAVDQHGRQAGRPPRLLHDLAPSSPRLTAATTIASLSSIDRRYRIGSHARSAVLVGLPEQKIAQQRNRRFRAPASRYVPVAEIEADQVRCMVDALNAARPC